MTSRTTLKLLFCLSLALFAGCAGYQLGPTNGMPAGARSIRVQPVDNQTFEPRLDTAVGQALRKSLQQDGTFTLSTDGAGDILLDTAILEYDRSALSFDPDDIISAREFDILISARVKARERVTGKIILDRIVYGRTTILAGRDLNSIERQAFPLLADDLARSVTALLVDGQW